jgi:predicted nucleic acid-binding protein
MIVVADTSPLNYLIRLGHPNVLHKIYGRVLVPHAVLIEMQHPGLRAAYKGEALGQFCIRARLLVGPYKDGKRIGLQPLL